MHRPILLLLFWFVLLTTTQSFVRATSLGVVLSDPGVNAVVVQDPATPPTTATPPAESATTESTATTDLSGQNQQAVTEPALTAANPSPGKLISVGSLSQDGQYRYLLTFSTTGGALLRAELNARDRSGRYAYRDLEHFGGYLGKLELQNSERGVQVGIVGRETPAAIAGIEAGDVIMKFNGEPVTSLSDFERLLVGTKTGQTVDLEIRRGSSESESVTLTKSVTLTDQPLELLTREQGIVEASIQSQPSFLLSLLKIDEPDWKEITPGMRDGQWEFEQESTPDGETLTFSYTLDNETLEKFQLNGPLVVKKKFSLPKLGPELAADLVSKTFDIGFEIFLENQGSTDQTLGIRLDGPTGATTEGWWYQNKVHGNSSAIFGVAGARDVISSTKGTPYYFWSGPTIVGKNTGVNAAPQYIVSVPKGKGAQNDANALNFLGVDTQYFNISLLPEAADTNSEANYQCYSALAYVASNKIPTEKFLRRRVDCSFIIFDKMEVPAGQVYRQKFAVFAGPKERELLDEYGLQSTRTFGWFSIVSRLLCWLLKVFYVLSGSFSYGIAIVMLTVLVRLLVMPISRKAARNAQFMQLLSPEMKRIAKKYEGDPLKARQAQQELFRKHKFNPMGGCWLGLVQLPIFIGLYKGLSVDIALRDQPLIPGMSWCSNLAAPDQLFYWKEYLFSWLGGESGWLGPYFNVLPLITIALFLIQQKLFTPPATDDQQIMAQRIMSYMMIFMCVMFFKVPSGLCIYFITSSIWAIVERTMLPKSQLSEDKVNAIKESIGANGQPVETKVLPSTPETNTPESVGLFSRIRGAIETAQGKKAAPMDAESLRQQDRDRKKRLRDLDR